MARRLRRRAPALARCGGRRHDEPGEKHAAAVVASCRKRGIPAALLRLDGLPPKGDVSDWLDGGGTPNELLRLAEATLQEDGPARKLVPRPQMPA